MGIETSRKLKTFFIVILLVTISSCSLTKGKGLAESAVAQFHAQYNSGQFREIYNQAEEDLRKYINEADFVELLEGLHQKLGTVKQANQTGWHVNAGSEGTTVTLGYEVEFSEGKGTEQFVFRISDDKALLYKYNVNTPLLMRRLFRFCVSGDNQLFSLERTRLCHRLDQNCSMNY